MTDREKMLELLDDGLDLAEQVEKLREALQLIADRPFTAALDAREMRAIAREALVAVPLPEEPQ